MRAPRLALAASLAALALTTVACEGGTEGGGGDAPSASVASGPIVVTPGATGPFPLQGGIYRIGWKTTGCANIVISLQGDSGFQREKTSTIPSQTWVVPGVEPGNYTIAQTDPACADWELNVSRIGGG